MGDSTPWGVRRTGGIDYFLASIVSNNDEDKIDTWMFF